MSLRHAFTIAAAALVAAYRDMLVAVRKRNAEAIAAGSPRQKCWHHESAPMRRARHPHLRPTAPWRDFSGTMFGTEKRPP